MLRIVIILCFVAFSPSAMSEAYLCTAETAAGLTYNKKSNKWEGWHTDKPNYQLVFKPLLDTDKKGSEAEYGFYNVSSGKLIQQCDDWRAEVGIAFCADRFQNFKFSRETANNKGKYEQKARFIAYDLGLTFFRDTSFLDDGIATPSVVMGGCIKIN